MRNVKKPLWIFYVGQLVGVVAIFIGGLFRVPIGIAVLIGVAIIALSYVIYLFRARNQRRRADER